MAQQGPPPRRTSRQPESGWPGQPEDREAGPGRPPRRSHRADTADPQWPDQPAQSSQASRPPAGRRHARDPEPPGDWPVQGWQPQPGQGGPGHGGPAQYQQPQYEQAPYGQAEYGQVQPAPDAWQDDRVEWPDSPDPVPGRAAREPAGQAGVAERGRRPLAGQRSGRGGRDTWRDQDPFGGEEESEPPPWAGLSIRPTGPGGVRIRPPEAEPEEQPDEAPAPRRRGRGRAAAARLRKSRRRVYVWCGTAIVLAVIVAGVAILHGLPGHKSKPDFISTFQPGEFKTVPSACTTVSSALLGQYLPGSARKVTPASTGTGQSQCSFTVDAKPVFRVLEVTIQAYQPSLIQAGNGSATDNAEDTYQSARQQLAAPGKRSPLPPAQLAQLTGLGQQALSAIQVIHANNAVTDLLTVMARDHNVVATVSLQAQASGDGFGPVSVSQLRAGALAICRAVMAQAMAQPAVKA